jgi:hypothetical protein
MQQPAPFAGGDQQEPGLRSPFIRTSANRDRHRRVDRHLIDDGFDGFDVGCRLADVCFGDLTFLARVAVDRLLVGGLCLIEWALVSCRESVAWSGRASGALPCSASWRVRSNVFCASTTTDSKRTLIDRLIESL